METTTYHKRMVSAAFLLDPPKLSRMLSILEERYAAVELPFRPTYSLKLSKGKSVELTDVDEVLELDNAVKNPIRMLKVTVAESGIEGSLEATLRFDGLHASTLDLSVTGSDARAANQLFVELEEQLERAVQTSWVYRFVKTGRQLVSRALLFYAGAMLVLLASALILAPSTPSRAEYRALREQARTAATQEQKIDFIFAAERQRMVDAAPNRALNVELLTSPRTWFVVVPLVLILMSVTYLLYLCYPRAVFLWGDYAEHYESLRSRRRTLWTVIVASLVIGVLSSLVASSLAATFGL
jgi:hypothetical protein